MSKIKSTKLKTSKTEILHLMMAWIVISFAFAVLLNNGKFDSAFGKVFLAATFSVGIGFLLHELAHKIIAQRYGFFAEFRADFMMLLIAVAFSFFGFILAAPGAVFIKGNITKEKNGKISLAGPLTNIVLSLIFLGLFLALRPENFFLNLTLKYGMLINAWLAAFNMIPIWNFDGRKILKWNKVAYAITLISAIVLAFISYLF